MSEGIKDAVSLICVNPNCHYEENLCIYLPKITLLSVHFGYSGFLCIEQRQAFSATCLNSMWAVSVVQCKKTVV